MKILLIGATGYIGGAILKELLRHEYHVVALTRSKEAEAKLYSYDVEILRGDIKKPDDWVEVLHNVDGVVHVAATFQDDMGDVDRTLMASILKESDKLSKPIKFIYTGGVWLYGNTGGEILDETAPFNSIPSFNWMLDGWKEAQSAKNLTAIFMHPGMVYDEIGGTLDLFISSAKNQKQIEVWGSTDINWSMVHRNDLAVAYRFALEKGEGNQSYIASNGGGVCVHDIVSVLQEAFKLSKPFNIRSTQSVLSEHGEWAEGYLLNQSLSSKKIENDLGWSPVYQGCCDGLKDYFDQN